MSLSGNRLIVGLPQPDLPRCRWPCSTRSTATTRSPTRGCKGAEFQSKDLGETLSRYTVTREGRLIRHARGADLGADEDRAARRTDTAGGEEIRHHGDIHIYTSDSKGDLVEFRVRFTHGLVEWIRPESSTITNESTPTLAMLADAVDDWAQGHSVFEAELLQKLEQLDPEVTKEAIYVFDDRGDAATWLTRPNRALGDLSPYRALAQGDRQLVLDELGRILHGIYR